MKWDFGSFTSSENIFSITPKTTYAWLGEITVMKDSLKGIEDIFILNM